MNSKLILLSTGDFETLDDEVQESIYQEFYFLVYGLIMTIVKDRDFTEDIIQESFLKALRNPPEIEHEMQLKAWIRVVARNTTMNYLRKFKHKRQYFVDSETIFAYGQQAATEESTENIVETNALQDKITEYLHELKPEYKMLVELRWKHSMTYSEIADYTEGTVGGVRQKLHRAREVIRRRVQDDWDHDESDSEQ